MKLYKSTLALAAILGLNACADDEVEEPRPRLEIIIDDNGIPHIYGRTDNDAFYGAGYQMASDRLFHMETTRRRAHGTLAEVLGEEAYEDDELSRIFSFHLWGQRHTDKMKADAPAMYELLSHWVDGVNARIEMVHNGDVPLPQGFRPEDFDFVPEPWTVVDIMAIATMTGFGNDLTFDAEAFATIAFMLAPEPLAAVKIFQPAREVFTTNYGGSQQQQRAPADPEQAKAPRPPAYAGKPIPQEDIDKAMRTLVRLNNMRVGMGSNNWAVSGEHTDSGMPLMAGDPHLDWDIPGIFYALHINSKDQDGDIDAAGFSFVGTPGVSVGHTRGVAWTPTTAFADTMDVWTVQRPDPMGPITLAGEELAVDAIEEIIMVRQPGDAVGEGSPRSVMVQTVEGRGVILPAGLVPIPIGEPGDVLMMNWIGFQPNAFASLLDFNLVENVDDYEVAVDGFGANFNFVAADKDSITHRVGTRIPARTVNPDQVPWLVMDGDDASTLWNGEVLPPEQLPGSRGEGRGFVVTANNDPFGHSADGDLANDPFYFGAFFAPGWRAERIENELTRLTTEKSGAITREDMEVLQNDTHSNIADDLMPILDEAFANIGSDDALAEFEGRGDLQTLHGLLTQWDRNYTVDNPATVVFFAYQHFITQRAIGDDIQLLFLEAMNLQPVFIIKIAVNAMAGRYPDGDAVLQEGRDWISLAALSDTANFLTERFGSVDPSGYSAADIKFVQFNGTTGRGIDRGKHPIAGSDDTVAVAANHNFFSPAGGADEEWLSKHGSIFRTITTFDEGGTPQMWFNMPLGNVGEPESPHYDDFNEDWLQGEYRRFFFHRDDVEEHEEERFLLLEETPTE